MRTTKSIGTSETRIELVARNTWPQIIRFPSNNDVPAIAPPSQQPHLYIYTHIHIHCITHYKLDVSNSNIKNIVIYLIKFIEF